jgi:formylglycine-generating enzyme required for sulfatase activity
MADEQDVAEETDEATAPPLAVAPFDAAAAKAHQEAWAKHLGVPVEVTNSIGMKLRLIPPGEFMTGSPTSEQGRRDNETQHRVRITKPFYLGLHEVTIEQFRAFVKARHYQTEAERHGRGDFFRMPQFTWWDAEFRQEADHPVLYISWNDAVAFCAWLSNREKRPYRLPTEAEWEYACRAGSTTRLFFGDDASMLDEYAWYRDNADHKTHPVGQKKPNAWGLCDMHGNVYEWCSDWYSSGYYTESPVDDPTGPTSGSIRVGRGGSWYSTAGHCRSAGRGSDLPSLRYYGLGFHVAFSSVDQSSQ